MAITGKNLWLHTACSTEIEQRQLPLPEIPEEPKQDALGYRREMTVRLAEFGHVICWGGG